MRAGDVWEQEIVVAFPHVVKNTILQEKLYINNLFIFALKYWNYYPLFNDQHLYDKQPWITVNVTVVSIYTMVDIL